MDALAVTAITDFLLAGQTLFLAGLLMARPMAPDSAARPWSLAMLLLGLAALAGGIDHGFVEPAGLPRQAMQRGTWLLLAAMTLCVVLTLARRFAAGRRRRWIEAAGALQFVAFAAALTLLPSFTVVIVNYVPVMLAFLLLNLLRLRSGQGSWPMVAGTLTLFAASALQALGVDTFSPLDHNGLYHLVSMPGVLLLYLGGRRYD